MDTPCTAQRKCLILLILDGFGYRQNGLDNAIYLAKTPNWSAAWNRGVHTLVDASGPAVGLPAGQMGNSEVGHLNIGAGRVVQQELTRIDAAIDSGTFEKNPVLLAAIDAAKRGSGRVHILGLLSDGGVHSHQSHIFAIAGMCASHAIEATYVHAFLDGRDTPPKSATRFLKLASSAFEGMRNVRIASVCGRYFAMDRDKRWDRIQRAYSMLVEGIAECSAKSPMEAIQLAYSRGESDEFVVPTIVEGNPDSDTRIRDGDVVVFANFRADRARQLTQAFVGAPFTDFPRNRQISLAYFCSLTSYGEQFRHPVAFEAPELRDHFGSYISRLGLRQLRIAETEKYAHVTYFFSGGNEEKLPGEDRILIPSPKVATYDQAPEMSASAVSTEVVKAISSHSYDAIICNFANCDMVGHTGNLGAAILAVEAIDACLGEILKAAEQHGAEVVVTADHGNVEMMVGNDTGQPHTAHTTNLVPFVYVGRSAVARSGGSLRDIAPTLLQLMALDVPPAMTGRSLLTGLEA